MTEITPELYEDRMRRLVDLWHATPGIPWDGGFIDWFMAGCPAEPEPQPAKPARPKRQRKPGLRSQVARTEKAVGQPVASITTPEGYTLHFGATNKPGNALDDWLAKHAH